MSADQYADIIEQLEKATGPDTEIDARIWCEFAGVKYARHFPAYGDEHLTQVEFTQPPKRTRCVTSNRGPHRHAAAYTASLDAALALVGEKLPGAGWRVVSDDANGIMANVFWNRRQFGGLGSNPPLAVLLALFKALQQQEREG